MADLDTTSKRRSAVQLLHPWLNTPPVPTLALGDIDQADRQHLALIYGGIAASSTGVTGTSAIAIGPLVLSGTGSQTQTGTSAIAIGLVVLSGTGTQQQVGTSSIAIGPLVLLATGSQTQTGTSALAIGPIVIIATGSQAQTSTGSIAIGLIEVSGVGDTSGSVVLDPTMLVGGSLLSATLVIRRPVQPDGGGGGTGRRRSRLPRTPVLRHVRLAPVVLSARGRVDVRLRVPAKVAARLSASSVLVVSMGLRVWVVPVSLFAYTRARVSLHWRYPLDEAIVEEWLL